MSLPEKRSWFFFFSLPLLLVLGVQALGFSVTEYQNSVPESQDRGGFSDLLAFPEAEEQAGVPGDRAVYLVGQENPVRLGPWRTGFRLHLPESI